MKKFLLFFIVLISIIIYFATAQSRENARLFKQMCENKEYRIEIVDGNYTAEDLYSDKISIYRSKADHNCGFGLNCPKKTTLFHKKDIFLFDGNKSEINSYLDMAKRGKLIAKVYDVFRPYSSLENALNFEGYSKQGQYCNFITNKKTIEILIENLNKKDKK